MTVWRSNIDIMIDADKFLSRPGGEVRHRGWAFCLSVRLYVVLQGKVFS